MITGAGPPAVARTLLGPRTVITHGGQCLWTHLPLRQLMSPLRYCPSGIRLRRRAEADQVPVTERPVDPADRGEVLVRRRHPGREHRLGPRVRVLPVTGQRGRGVRRAALA